MTETGAFMETDRGKRNTAYLRVSRPDQDTEKNKADVLAFANERDFGRVEFVEEKVSGRKPWRDRKLSGIIESLGHGDRLLVPELTRLGRSTLEVLEILKVCQEKGIFVFSVKERLEMNNGMQSKIMSTFLAMFAELERDFISQRTKEGLRARKAAGVKLGRPRGPGKSKLDKHRPEIEALIKNGSSKSFIAKRCNTTPGNLQNWLKKNGLSDLTGQPL